MLNSDCDEFESCINNADMNARDLDCSECDVYLECIAAQTEQNID